VKDDREPKLMAYPHLLVREAIVFEVLIIAMVLIALFWDAPLEQLANPLLTPNPAKAPWYFLGLQELLHFFPPFVAGILIPTLVLLSLIVIPYFNLNVGRARLKTLRPGDRCTDRSVDFAGRCGRMDHHRPYGAGGRTDGRVVFIESHDGLDGHTAQQAVAVVDHDLVHRCGALPDGGGDVFPGPRLVLGMAMGETCRLKTWVSCHPNCGSRSPRLP
jgi:hypothetical protein